MLRNHQHIQSVLYPPSSRLSMTMIPGASRRMSRASSSSRNSSNSMFNASEWPTKNGTRTQVAVILTTGSRFSWSAFHLPLFFRASSSMASMCGITLKAICLVNFLGSTSLTGLCLYLIPSSSIPSLPAPDVD